MGNNVTINLPVVLGFITIISSVLMMFGQILRLVVRLERQDSKIKQVLITVKNIEEFLKKKGYFSRMDTNDLE